MEIKRLSGGRRAYDRTLRFLLYLCAFITCALLVVSAIFANMDKRAYAIPYGQPPRQG